MAASDVRRRLLEHYERCGAASSFRITLPQGCYVPEITQVSLPPKVTHESVKDAVSEVSACVPEKGNIHGSASKEVIGFATTGRTSVLPRLAASLWFIVPVVVFALFGLALVGESWRQLLHTRVAQGGAPSAAVSMLPWSSFFGRKNAHLITSDPDIFWIQRITGKPISVSDYANRIYFPGNYTIPPVMKEAFQGALRGDKSASVDVPIAMSIETLGISCEKTVALSMSI